MARRSKKRATVILLVGQRETTHRGNTLKSALATGVRTRLPSDCSVKWGKMHKLASGRAAGGEGVVQCPRRPQLDGAYAYFIALRKRRYTRGL
jgi:hypothetical protein